MIITAYIFIKPSRNEPANKICSHSILCNYKYFVDGLTEAGEVLLLASETMQSCQAGPRGIKKFPVDKLQSGLLIGHRLCQANGQSGHFGSKRIIPIGFCFRLNKQTTAFRLLTGLLMH